MTRITLLVSLPLLATTGLILVMSFFSRFHNRLFVATVFVIFGSVFTALAAWRFTMLVDERQKVQEQQLAERKALEEELLKLTYAVTQSPIGIQGSAYRKGYA